MTYFGTPTIDYWRGRPVVYRCYNSAGDLLYIGTTMNAGSRLRQHQASTPWFADVARTVVKLHPTKQAAHIAEAQAIRTERPRMNIRYAPGWQHWRHRTTA